MTWGAFAASGARDAAGTARERAVMYTTRPRRIAAPTAAATAGRLPIARPPPAAAPDPSFARRAPEGGRAPVPDRGETGGGNDADSARSSFNSLYTSSEVW